LRTRAPSQLVSPISLASGFARATISSAAVWPVTANTSLFWMVAKNVLAVCAVPS